ncbi:MAG: hypothetical protein IJC99_01880 [Clostridia bacterium]|nr:hypothetical protein [Clostridia bacterium]
MSSQQNAVLTVNECTNEGIITATYNYVAPGCKYSKQILTGKIVYKDVYGNMLVDFFDQNIVYSTFQEELPAIGAVYFDENFSTVHIGFYDYKNSTQYILSSPADLKKMNGSSATFVLINDIDFDGISFEPINNFRGTLFGNGYSLKNISISSTSSNVGIFNSMRSGYIIDLCVTDAHITVTGTNSNVGILCGSTESSIYNVLVSGEVNAPLCNYVGGVAGFSKYSVPGMLTNAANVIGKDYVGGCFGYQTTVKNITLYDCKNSGIIRGNKYVGGIIGHAKQTSNTLKYELQNCSNSGLIEGDNCVGGYIGYAEIYSSVIQNECISTGNVRGSTHVSASIGKPYK